MMEIVEKAAILQMINLMKSLKTKFLIRNLKRIRLNHLKRITVQSHKFKVKVYKEVILLWVNLNTYSLELNQMILLLILNL